MGAGAGPWAVVGDEGLAGVVLRAVAGYPGDRSAAEVVAGAEMGLAERVEGDDCGLDDGTTLEGDL